MSSWLLANDPENINKGVLFYNFEQISAKIDPSHCNFNVKNLYDI